MRKRLFILSIYLLLAAACGKSNMVTPVPAPDPVVTFYGINTTNGVAGGALVNADFNYPIGVTTDPAGNIYIADQYNQLIRKVTPDGQVSVYAGDIFKFGKPGHVDGNALSAQFDYPGYLALDPPMFVQITKS